MSQQNLPTIIQGGMGVAVSDWRLARAVSRLGQLGVVSGTGISRVLSSRLMDGDTSGLMRHALSTFPMPEPVKAILKRYFIPGGKAANEPYRSQPVPGITPANFLDELTTIANYVEVFLAKEKHKGVVGINLLEKIQLPNLASLYGAMLAGVDYVLMGAGIPMQVAAILDKLQNHQAVSYRLDVQGAAPEDDIRIHFDPQQVFPGIAERVGQLKRPKFLPIISSHLLAQALLRRSEGKIDGFIIESPTAGGHNAPPRGTLKLNDLGEPVYSEKDAVDLDKIKSLGLPFWLAGSRGNPEELKKALAAGAAGIQVGTAFSLCEESGLEPELKQQVLEQVLSHQIQVFTSPKASPTGFPFKVALVPGTMSDPDIYQERKRICDIGLLRTMFKDPKGNINYRCPAEPVDDYLRKGGNPEDTEGRTCLCNNLLAAAGFPQQRKDGYVEVPIVTSGDDLLEIGQFVKPDRRSYSAQDVLNFLLEEVSQLPNTEPDNLVKDLKSTFPLPTRSARDKSL